jgi:hypothetical protein
LPLSLALERQRRSTRAREAEGWGRPRVCGGHVTAMLFGWRAVRTRAVQLSRGRSKRTQERPGLSDSSHQPFRPLQPARTAGKTRAAAHLACEIPCGAQVPCPCVRPLEPLGAPWRPETAWPRGPRGGSARCRGTLTRAPYSLALCFSFSPAKDRSAGPAGWVESADRSPRGLMVPGLRPAPLPFSPTRGGTGTEGWVGVGSAQRGNQMLLFSSRPPVELGALVDGLP